MAEIFLKGEKTLWEKEKFVTLSNFSFYHSVYKRPVLQTHKILGLFWKGLRSIYIIFCEYFLVEQG